MIFQLGPVKFESLVSPIRNSRSRSLNIVQHERIGSKDTVQDMGESLTTIKLDFELIYRFCDVRETYSRLNDVYEARAPVDFIDGSGYSYGVFIITSIEDEILAADSRGIPLHMTFALSLLEYAPYERETAQQIGARKNAFASIKVNPIEVKPKALVVTPPAAVSRDIMASVTASRGAVNAIKKANDVPSLALKYLAQGKQSLEAAQMHINNALSGVSLITDVVSNAGAIEDTLEAVKNSVTSMNSNFTIGNLSSLTIVSDTLSSDLNLLISRSTNLNSIVATRL